MSGKNIIFDLGGVIEEISPSSVITSFKKIGLKNADTFFSLYRQSDICSDFETGDISINQFIEYIRGGCHGQVSDEEIITAWCANQLGVTKNTVQVLKILKERGYKLYILSNTNPVHYRAITLSFYKAHQEDFESLFDGIYLSYTLKARKPNIEPFQKLIEFGLVPSRSVYIDDLKENLTAPSGLGFSTVLHKTNASIHYLLSDFA